MKVAINLLQELLDSLPKDHYERPGIMRSIELLRVDGEHIASNLTPFDAFYALSEMQRRNFGIWDMEVGRDGAALAYTVWIRPRRRRSDGTIAGHQGRWARPVYCGPHADPEVAMVEAAEEALRLFPEIVQVAS